MVDLILYNSGKTTVCIGQKLDGQQQNTSVEKDVDMQALHAWKPTVENFQRTHCRGTRRYTSPGESTHELGWNRSIYTTLPDLSECNARIAR